MTTPSSSSSSFPAFSTSMFWPTLFEAPKPLIGQFSLPPLPGTPGWFGLLEFWSHRVEQEALALRSSGVDGLLLNLKPEVQGTLEALPAEAWALLSVWLTRLQTLCECPLGLSLAPTQTQPVNWLVQAGLLQWVRLWVGSGTRLTPLGWMPSTPKTRWPHCPLWVEATLAEAGTNPLLKSASVATSLPEGLVAAHQNPVSPIVPLAFKENFTNQETNTAFWLEAEDCSLEAVAAVFQEEAQGKAPGGVLCEGLVFGDTLRKPQPDSKGLAQQWPSYLPVETIDPLQVEAWVKHLRGRKQSALYPSSSKG
jgi:BtpA family